MMWSFYLAGSYWTRGDHAALARRIETATGAVCTSTWLKGDEDGMTPPQIALMDCRDLRRADSVVLVHGRSSTGGMWTELGMAIALNKPTIILVRRNKRNHRVGPSLPVFAWMNQVACYETNAANTAGGKLCKHIDWPASDTFLEGTMKAFQAHLGEGDAT